MDDTPTLPPTIQKLSQDILDVNAAILHWWRHLEQIAFPLDFIASNNELKWNLLEKYGKNDHVPSTNIILQVANRWRSHVLHLYIQSMLSNPHIHTVIQTQQLFVSPWVGFEILHRQVSLAGGSRRPSIVEHIIIWRTVNHVACREWRRKTWAQHSNAPKFFRNAIIVQ